MIVRALLLLLGVTAIGCAQLAKQPPTPAKEFSAKQLGREPTLPSERYFSLIFGSQSTSILFPRQTHTWTAVVKVTESALGAPQSLEISTISWMPASLQIRPLHFCVEPGANLELHQTIRQMLSRGQRVSLWGPYEIIPGQYKKILMQKEFVESGRIGYQCIDTLSEAAHRGNGSDCIHAITDMDSMFSRGGYPLSRFGERASEHIVEQIMVRDIVINPSADHNWLFKELGLDRYAICRRQYRGPSLSFRFRLALAKMSGKNPDREDDDQCRNAPAR